jgi:hypothetical protein
MHYKSHPSITSISILLLIVFSLTACGAVINSDVESRNEEEGDQTWQYKLTIVTDIGETDALKENGTVIFDGEFALDRASGVILPDEGKVTVSGSYRCREANSDPPRMLEGTLEGEHSFSLDGLLIPPKDYTRFNVMPLEPLTEDAAPSEYARVSIPKVVDRNRVTVSFGRENCTNSGFTPVIAEVISFGQIPFFNLEHSPFFIVLLDPQAAYLEQIELNHDGSQVLSKAELCIALPGKCP